MCRVLIGIDLPVGRGDHLPTVCIDLLGFLEGRGKGEWQPEVRHAVDSPPHIEVELTMDSTDSAMAAIQCAAMPNLSPILSRVGATYKDVDYLEVSRS